MPRELWLCLSVSRLKAVLEGDCLSASPLMGPKWGILFFIFSLLLIPSRSPSSMFLNSRTDAFLTW